MLILKRFHGFDKKKKNSKLLGLGAYEALKAYRARSPSSLLYARFSFSTTQPLLGDLAD